MWVVSFQWRPPANFSGLVQFRATVVESYEVFWLGVASASLAVTAAGARLPGAALGGDRRTSYYNPRQGEGRGGQEEGVSYPDFVSLFEDYPGLENSSSDGKTAGSDKSNMSRAALAVTTHQVGGDSGYLEHDLNHDLTSPLSRVCVSIDHYNLSLDTRRRPAPTCSSPHRRDTAGAGYRDAGGGG